MNQYMDNEPPYINVFINLADDIIGGNFNRWIKYIEKLKRGVKMTNNNSLILPETSVECKTAFLLSYLLP